MRSSKICIVDHSLGDKIEESETGRACGMYGKKRNTHRFLVGQPEEKRSLGEPIDKENDDIEV